MIELHCQNKIAYVYKLEDWKILRTEHKIIGEIVGTNQFVPSLPLMLLPEEAILLINKGIAKLVKYEILNNEPTEEMVNFTKEFQINLLEEERKLTKDIRRQQLEYMKDKIVQAKKKKGDTRNPDEILDDELNKSCYLNHDNMIWPIFTQHLQDIRGTSKDVPMDVLLSATTNTKCKVYKDFYERGFHITAGNKFGGDFLIYLGDPLLFHAVYIVRCVEDINKTMHTSEIVAFGRLGTSVKKKAILAAVNADNTLSYLTINWIDA